MEDCDKLLWDRLRDISPYKRRGGKAVMGRFMEVIRRIRRELQDYSAKKFFVIATCLELDLFKSKLATRKLLEPGVEKTTHAKKSSDKQELDLARACINQTAIAGLSMLDPECLRKDWIIVQGTRHWDLRHGHQNTYLRSCQAAGAWLRNELRHNFTKTLGGCWDDMVNENIMVRIGLKIHVKENDIIAMRVDDIQDTQDQLTVTFSI